MAERLHPGVYVEEKSSGVRPIESAVTATAGFIGVVSKGRPNHAHFVRNFEDFSREFGGHQRGPNGFLAQAVEAFFVAGGQRGYVVRVVPQDAIAGLTPNVATRTVRLDGTAIPAVALRAAGEGAWSTALSVQIEDARSPSTVHEAFRLRVFRATAGVRREVEVFEDLVMNPEDARYFVSVLEDGSQLVRGVDQFSEFLAANPGEVVTSAVPATLRAENFAVGDARDFAEDTLFYLSTTDTTTQNVARLEVPFTQATAAALTVPIARERRNGRWVFPAVTLPQLHELFTDALAASTVAARFWIEPLAQGAVVRIPAGGNWDLQGETVSVTFGTLPTTQIVVLDLSGAGDLQAVTPQELTDALNAGVEGAQVGGRPITVTLANAEIAIRTAATRGLDIFEIEQTGGTALNENITPGRPGADRLAIHPNVQRRTVAVGTPGSLAATWDLSAGVTIAIGGAQPIAVPMPNGSIGTAIGPAELAASLSAVLAPLGVQAHATGGGDVELFGNPGVLTQNIAIEPVAELGGLTVVAGGVIAPADFDTNNIAIGERVTGDTPPVLAALGFRPTSEGFGVNSPSSPAVRPAVTDDGNPVRVVGGDDGAAPVTPANFRGEAGARTGLHALDAVDVPMLLMPGQNDPAFTNELLAYADSRGENFAILDGPGADRPNTEVSPADAEVFVRSLPNRSRNAAMYYPWLEVSDVLGVGRNPTRFVGPSGHVAGIFARTDATRGVWKAPAGIESTVPVQGVQYDVLDADQDLLNPASLNCIRRFDGVGIVTWGTRTLSSDPEWRYVPVRRTAILLKTSIKRGIQWAVFEPNDTILWGRLKTNIEAFMFSLYRQGAFQGTSPEEAFRVICDRSTNPQELVDQGVVTTRVEFAPLKPAEFVVVEISQKSLLGG